MSVLTRILLANAGPLRWARIALLAAPSAALIVAGAVLHVHV